MTLKELRKRCGLTQPEAADIVGVPFRTYCRYEDEASRAESFKYKQFMKILEDYTKARVLPLDMIRDVAKEVFSPYAVDACYLYGSYAKGAATKASDIDLMIVSSVSAGELYYLLGSLERKLGKKVDLIRLEIAVRNGRLIKEILKDGIKIYKHE